ncbi:MAG: hypothetical protein WAT17_04485 [Candidatus Saccharimonadales bacterium]
MSTTTSPLNEADKVRLMHLIKRIAEIYDKCSTGQFDRSAGYRKGGVSPDSNQTIAGLYLEFYYGHPSKLWTPWGDWRFGGTQSSKFNLEEFMSRLTLEVHTEGHQEWIGYIGPVYAILAVDGEPAPTPSLKATQSEYTPYEDAMSERNRLKAEWERLFR